MQAGDIAFSVPSSLIVTLERVLGNETVGKMLFNFTKAFFIGCAYGWHY